jgi:hypothetical protein
MKILKNLNNIANNLRDAIQSLTGDNRLRLIDLDANIPGMQNMVGGRLNANPNNPTKIYYRPFSHASLPLYGGNVWEMVTINDEIMYDYASDTDIDGNIIAGSKLYDIYGEYISSSSLFGMKLKPWLDSTAGGSSRGYSPYVFEGVKVLDSSTTGKKYRLLGTCYLDSSVYLWDTNTKRNLNNRFNKLNREIYFEHIAASTATTTTTQNTWVRCPNNTDEFMLQFVADGESVCVFTMDAQFEMWQQSNMGVCYGIAVDVNSIPHTRSSIGFIYRSGESVFNTNYTICNIDLAEGYHRVWPMVTTGAASTNGVMHFRNGDWQHWVNSRTKGDIIC